MVKSEKATGRGFGVGAGCPIEINKVYPKKKTPNKTEVKARR